MSLDERVDQRLVTARLRRWRACYHFRPRPVRATDPWRGLEALRGRVLVPEPLSEVQIETSALERNGRGETAPARSLRMLWVLAGLAALGIAAVGVLLPLLPTTPFVILAAFAFGKGSPNLRRWLVNHRRFGPAIRDWEAHGAIARRYKVLACALMALTFTGSALAGLAPWVLAVQALCMMTAATYVLSRPGGPSPGISKQGR